MIFKTISKCTIINVILVIVLSFCLLPSSYIQADSKPFLHPVFSDSMVLQRDIENNIWGWTSAGEKVTVEIGAKASSCIADSSGK